MDGEAYPMICVNGLRQSQVVPAPQADIGLTGLGRDGRNVQPFADSKQKSALDLDRFKSKLTNLAQLPPFTEDDKNGLEESAQRAAPGVGGCRLIRLRT